MKKRYYLLAFFIFNINCIRAQIGIGTTSPSSQLDIRSSNQITPANNDGILIPKVDAFSLINPTAAQQGMLVYLTAATTFGGNPKAKGFYYWDFTTLDWIGISSAANGDHDWYEEGTTLAPEDITDDMFHTGNVAIGKNTTDFPLEIENTTFDTTINTTSVFNTSNSILKYGFRNTITGNTNDDTYGTENSIITSGTGTITGTKNTLTNPNSSYIVGTNNNVNNSFTGNATGILNSTLSYDGAAIAVDNTLNSLGSGVSTGVNNTINSVGTGVQYGLRNTMNNTGLNTKYGVFSDLNGTSSLDQFGVRNNISVGGDGVKYGIYNNMTSVTGNGNTIGTSNSISATGNGEKTGVENNITSNATSNQYGVKSILTGNGNSTKYGIRNDFTSNGTSINYGSYSSITGNSNGIQYANYNDITNTGSGNHYGNYNVLSGTGTGEQYGSYTSITNTGTNTKYGNYIDINSSATGAKVGNFTRVTSTSASASPNNAILTQIINSVGSGDNTGMNSDITNNGSGNSRSFYSSLGGISNGIFTGYYNFISSTGTGDKYGLYNRINPASGGIHYGVYSEVLKPGVTNFAGYFLGNVGIGTTTLNTYTFPPSRGTNNQIMVTNGTGVVSWQNASSIQDHDWYEVGTLLAPDAITDSMFHTGNVSIGKNTNAYPLDVTSATRTINSVSTLGTTAAVFGFNTAALGAGAGGYGVAGQTGQSSSQAVRGEQLNTSGYAIAAINFGASGAGTGSGVYSQTTQSAGFGFDARNLNASGTAIISTGQNAGGTYLVAGSGGSFNGVTTGLHARNTSLGISEAIYSDNGGVVGRVNYWSGTTQFKIIGTGAVSTTAENINGERVTLYCPEAPEILFEDYGQGQLVNGSVHIEIDPTIAKNIVVNEKHPLRVYIQLEDDCNGVYVTNKTGSSFDVKELASGQSNAKFQYHIVGNRADELLPNGRISKNADMRFEPAPKNLETREVTPIDIGKPATIK